VRRYEERNEEIRAMVEGVRRRRRRRGRRGDVDKVGWSFWYIPWYLESDSIEWK